MPRKTARKSLAPRGCLYRLAIPTFEEFLASDTVQRIFSMFPEERPDYDIERGYGPLILFVWLRVSQRDPKAQSELLSSLPREKKEIALQPFQMVPVEPNKDASPF